MANERNAGRRFDRKCGVTTQAIVFLTDLDPERIGDAGLHATYYEPVPVRDFRQLIAHVPAEIIEASSFVDIGCGMGRALLLASEYPFRRVLGIEVSPGLAEIATANLTSVRTLRARSGDRAVIRADARIYRYPCGAIVAFMYNPFDGHAVRATLGALVSREAAGATWLIYHTPVERGVLDEDLGWSVVAETTKGIVCRYG